MYYPILNRLESIRHSRFIGRDAERKFFIDALQEDHFPFHILYLVGPGGIGKTELINEYIRICRLSRVVPIYIDSRNVVPDPANFMANLALKLGIQDQAPLQFLAESRERYIIFIDAYETMVPIDPWVRENLLPHISENVMLVMASKNSPAAAWFTDPGCRMIFKKLHLKYFTKNESITYLDLNGIPRVQHQSILDFAHGHPLALALIVDLFNQRPAMHFQPEEEPDIIRTLLELFIQQVPGPAHRTALEIASLARAVSEHLLTKIMGLTDVHEIFDWLRNLSFMEAGRRGIFPHDLAREALMHDLKWRNPEWYRELHMRIRAYFSNRIRDSRGEQETEALFDYIYLHRSHSFVRPFFEWQQSGNAYNDKCNVNDIPLIREMIERHEGGTSQVWFDFWYNRQPESVTVIRGNYHQPVGFLMKLALHLADPVDLETDPATCGVWKFLEHNSPLRQGESAIFFRFWMENESYQKVTSIQSLIFITIIQQNFRTPALAYTLFPCSDPDFWQPILTYADMHRIHSAEFKIDSKSFGVFGHDWRKIPANVWMEMLVDRELGQNIQEHTPKSLKPLLILNKAQFQAAVKNALHDLDSPYRLESNPLLRSRLVSVRAGENDQPDDQALILISEIKNAITFLKDFPRDEKYFRALDKTYLKSARSQEKASEDLGIPFSTYRRHLKNGINRLTDILWQKELNQT